MINNGAVNAQIGFTILFHKEFNLQL